MLALREIELTNFRSLASAKVSLGPLNVLVGPNGAGKSNLLDAIRFLGDSVRTDLGPALDAREGFENVLFRGARSRYIRIRIAAQATAHSSATAADEYSLRFSLVSPSGTANLRRSYLRRNESFTFKRTPKQGRRITIQGGNVEVVDTDSAKEPRTRTKELLRSDSLGLATLPRLAEEEGGKQVRQIAELFAGFRVVDIDVAAARGPAALDGGAELESDGANLSAFLHHLMEADPDRYDLFLDDARLFIPGLEALQFERVGGGSDYVLASIKESWLPGATKLADASFGSVRALALLAVLHDPEPPALTCIEEVDHGLHPYLFDRLVERLREASSRSQFLLATHSPALVSRLRTNELIVCERDLKTGATRMPAVSKAKMDEMVARIDSRLDLGEIWFSGALGGVPDA